MCSWKIVPKILKRISSIEKLIVVPYEKEKANLNVNFDYIEWNSIQDSDDLVDAIRKMEVMIGDGVKKVYDSEVPIAQKLRKVNDIV